MITGTNLFCFVTLPLLFLAFVAGAVLDRIANALEALTKEKE